MMKVSTVFFPLLLAVGPVKAWTTGNVLRDFVTAAGVAGAITLAPLTSNAAESVFNHEYSDPNHPNCKRIVVIKNGETFVSGTDGNPGCPADGSGNVWRLTGEVDGNNIFVDFSPKVSFLARANKTPWSVPDL
jgi:hypothetical protein